MHENSVGQERRTFRFMTVCVGSVVYNCLRPQAPPSMGLSRHQDWSRLPFPSPGDLPDPGIEPQSPVSPALEGKVLTAGPPGKFQRIVFLLILQIRQLRLSQVN